MMSMDKLTKNFTGKEFACPCCGKQHIAMELVYMLQDLRDIVDRPIYISSGYRCKKYNKIVGGYAKSKHMEGLAADIEAIGMAPKRLAELADESFPRIGIYPNHVHVGIALPPLYWVVKKYGFKYKYFDNIKDALDYV